jgi:hypothetical protein
LAPGNDAWLIARVGCGDIYEPLKERLVETAAQIKIGMGWMKPFRWDQSSRAA